MNQGPDHPSSRGLRNMKMFLFLPFILLNLKRTLHFCCLGLLHLNFPPSLVVLTALRVSLLSFPSSPWKRQCQLHSPGLLKRKHPINLKGLCSFSTTYLYNWKQQNPSFSEDPLFINTIFTTHSPTWEDCQQLLQVFLFLRRHVGSRLRLTNMFWDRMDCLVPTLLRSNLSLLETSLYISPSKFRIDREDEWNLKRHSYQTDCGDRWYLGKSPPLFPLKCSLHPLCTPFEILFGRLPHIIPKLESEHLERVTNQELLKSLQALQAVLPNIGETVREDQLPCQERHPPDEPEIQPIDWVWVKKYMAQQLGGKCTGLFQVILATPTAVKVADKPYWIQQNHLQLTKPEHVPKEWVVRSLGPTKVQLTMQGKRPIMLVFLLLMFSPHLGAHMPMYYDWRLTQISDGKILASAISPYLTLSLTINLCDLVEDYAHTRGLQHLANYEKLKRYASLPLFLR